MVRSLLPTDNTSTWIPQTQGQCALFDREFLRRCRGHVIGFPERQNPSSWTHNSPSARSFRHFCRVAFWPSHNGREMGSFRSRLSGSISAYNLAYPQHYLAVHKLCYCARSSNWVANGRHGCERCWDDWVFSEKKVRDLIVVHK